MMLNRAAANAIAKREAEAIAPSQLEPPGE